VKVAIVSDDHPILLYLRSLPGRKRVYPWAKVEEVEPWDALCFFPSLTISETDPEDLIEILEVPYSFLHRWVELRKEKGGVVLYGLTLEGVYGCPDLLLCERDGALLAQARGMALELGRFGIRVNTLIFGPLVHTPEEEKPLHRENPLRSLGTWGEAVKIVRLFLSPLMRHGTGESFVFAGGAQLTRAPI
jgi:hypothetical protein